MADPDLKTIPTKNLKKIARESNLNALLESKEGQDFFKNYLEGHPEFKKYWTFYNCVNEITASSDNLDQLWVLINQCFQSHIAIAADSEERVDRCLQNRSIVDTLNKSITDRSADHSIDQLQNLQKRAYEYLNQEVFPLLIKQFQSEVSSRIKSGKAGCDLS